METSERKGPFLLDAGLRLIGILILFRATLYSLMILYESTYPGNPAYSLPSTALIAAGAFCLIVYGGGISNLLMPSIDGERSAVMLQAICLLIGVYLIATAILSTAYYLGLSVPEEFRRFPYYAAFQLILIILLMVFSGPLSRFLRPVRVDQPANLKNESGRRHEEKRTVCIAPARFWSIYAA